MKRLQHTSRRSLTQGIRVRPKKYTAIKPVLLILTTSSLCSMMSPMSLSLTIYEVVVSTRYPNNWYKPFTLTTALTHLMYTKVYEELMNLWIIWMILLSNVCAVMVGSGITCTGACVCVPVCE